jgi:hypothetical protein
MVDVSTFTCANASELPMYANTPKLKNSNGFAQSIAKSAGCNDFDVFYGQHEGQKNSKEYLSGLLASDLLW